MSERRSTVWASDRETFCRVFNESNGIREALQKLGMSGNGGNYKTFKERCAEEGLDLVQMNERVRRANSDRMSRLGRRWRRRPLDQILTERSCTSRRAVKARLITEGLLDPTRCSICGMPDQWNGLPIVMIIDHINGRGDDHRLENLRLICPNCNSQLETFTGRNMSHKKRESPVCIGGCGKRVTIRSKTGMCVSCSRKAENFNDPTRNWKVKNRPSRDALADMSKQESWEAIGRRYGVSGTAVRKWATAYGLLNRSG